MDIEAKLKENAEIKVKMNEIETNLEKSSQNEKSLQEQLESSRKSFISQKEQFEEEIRKQMDSSMKNEYTLKIQLEENDRNLVWFIH